jgi:hypothetical protein
MKQAETMDIKAIYGVTEKDFNKIYDAVINDVCKTAGSATFIKTVLTNAKNHLGRKKDLYLFIAGGVFIRTAARQQVIDDCSLRGNK